jgi:hypothetical protein
LFTTGPGPEGGGSIPYRYGLPHTPEKLGIDAVPPPRSCVKAGEENRATAEVVAMSSVRII